MNKKKALLWIMITVLLVIAAGGVYGYKMLHSPGYAMKQTVEDVKQNGINALQSHVTSEIWDKVDTALTVAKNPLVGYAQQLIASKMDRGQMKTILSIVDRVASTEWTVLDITEGHSRASIVMQFENGDDIKGRFDLNMILQDGQWLIDSISFPVLYSA